jgi:hypothetical protein
VADGWTLVALDDVEAVPWAGTELEWRPLRSALDTRIVGMAVFTAERPGQELIEGAGTFIAVRDPAIFRAAVAAEPALRRLPSAARRTSSRRPLNGSSERARCCAPIRIVPVSCSTS